MCSLYNFSYAATEKLYVEVTKVGTAVQELNQAGKEYELVWRWSSVLHKCPTSVFETTNHVATNITVKIVFYLD